jgi:hypothetical protein
MLFLEYQNEESKEFCPSIYASILNLHAFKLHPIIEPRSLTQCHFIGKDETGLMAVNISASNYAPWIAGENSITTNKKMLTIDAIIPRPVGNEEEENVELFSDILKGFLSLALDAANKIPSKGINIVYKC